MSTDIQEKTKTPLEVKLPEAKKLTIKEVAESVNFLIKEMLLHKGRITSLEERMENKAEKAVERELPTTPVPMEYRQIVDSILNPKFGLRVQPMKDTPSFEFIIVCPQKYSTLNAEALKSIGGEDIRPKVIFYSEGINGVREWTERVWKSFNPDLQAMIALDRI